MVKVKDNVIVMFVKHVKQIMNFLWVVTYVWEKYSNTIYDYVCNILKENRVTPPSTTKIRKYNWFKFEIKYSEIMYGTGYHIIKYSKHKRKCLITYIDDAYKDMITMGVFKYHAT